MLEAEVHKVLVDLDRMGTDLLVVGAWARHLCLNRLFGDRATSDVDFLVQIERWEDLDDLLVKAQDRGFSRIDRDELRMTHTETGIPVDLVPCGAIERPPGLISHRGSSRRLNTTGALEAFATSLALESYRHLRVPSPAAFILLKCLAFTDRRNPNDLQDLGFVVRNFPIDEGRLWADTALMEAFSGGGLTYEDAPAWFAGRALASFEPNTADMFRRAWSALLGESESLRLCLVYDQPLDEPLAQADRLIAVVARALLA